MNNNSKFEFISDIELYREAPDLESIIDLRRLLKKARVDFSCLSNQNSRNLAIRRLKTVAKKYPEFREILTDFLNNDSTEILELSQHLLKAD